MWRKLKLSTKTYIVALGSVLIVTIYFSSHNFINVLESKEEANLKFLEGIAKSLATNIQPEQFEYLLSRYTQKDNINSSSQDSIYAKFHRLLKQTQNSNKLNSPIYTLTYQPEKDNFFFALTSSENPYFRHEYATYPPILKEKYNEGGVIPAYEDEHGTWLSSFYPIKSSNGNTLGVVQVDYFFKDFQQEAKDSLISDLVASIVAVLVTSVALFGIMRQVLKQEVEFKKSLEKEVINRTAEIQSQKDEITSLLQASREKTEELLSAEEELKQNAEELQAINDSLSSSQKVVSSKSKKLTDSIRYAQRIQSSMFVHLESFKTFFPNTFIFNKPKDIIGGDFYYFNVRERIFYIAVVDCTGHGVPGAFMSVIGYTLLDNIINEGQLKHSDEIVSALEERIITSLNQDKTENRDGMDLSLCVIDKRNGTLEFTGARNPLFYIQNNKINVLKGDRKSIGGIKRKSIDFTRQTISIDKSTTIYLASDGLQDQFGGEYNRKLGKSNLKSFLYTIHNLSVDKQSDEISSFFDVWQGSHPQTDDMLLIGIQLK